MQFSSIADFIVLCCFHSHTKYFLFALTVEFLWLLFCSNKMWSRDTKVATVYVYTLFLPAFPFSAIGLCDWFQCHLFVSCIPSFVSIMWLFSGAKAAITAVTWIAFSHLLSCVQSLSFGCHFRRSSMQKFHIEFFSGWFLMSCLMLLLYWWERNTN